MINYSGEYSYINVENVSSGELSRKEAPKHIKLQENEEQGSNSIASTVAEKLKNTYIANPDESEQDISRKLDRELRYVTEPKVVEEMLEGSMNLVNTVIERNNSGQPVDTLLFLDKSARNAAYLYTTLWRELESRGEIPTGLQRPEVRFMDIGQPVVKGVEDDKYTNNAAIFFLKKKYHHEDFTNMRVLVVDEFVSSGDSVKKAMASIEEIYSGSNTTGIAQFDKKPEWYGNREKGILGVSDLEKDPIYNKTRESLVNMDDDTAERLWGIYCKVDRDNFDSIMTQIRYRSGESIVSEDMQTQLFRNDRNNLTIDEITFAGEFIKKYDIKNGADDYVWQFIDSAGGFISRPLENSELNRNNHYYRKVLKSMVTYFMIERDVQKRQLEKSSVSQINNPPVVRPEEG